MYIKVKVKAGAKKEVVIKKSENSYEISVKEKAERNEANKRIIEIIARLLNISIQSIRLASGHKKHNKILLINENTFNNKVNF